MSRQRLRASVFESTTETCPTCNGAGPCPLARIGALQILRLIEEKLLQDNSLQPHRAHAHAGRALCAQPEARASARSGGPLWLTVLIEADDHLPAGMSYLFERGSSALAPAAPLKSGVRVDSVNVSDIELSEEEETPHEAAEEYSATAR